MEVWKWPKCGPAHQHLPLPSCRKMDALPSLTIPSQNVRIKGKLSRKEKRVAIGVILVFHLLLMPVPVISEFELQNRACHRKRVFLKKKDRSTRTDVVLFHLPALKLAL